jgi:hypothetical protein
MYKKSQVCHPEWRPDDKLYAEEEALHNHLYQEQARHIVAVHDEENFAKDLHDTHCVSALILYNPRFKMTQEVLATTWGFGFTIAKKTLESTTQRAVRTVANPTVESVGQQGTNHYNINDCIIKCSMTP